MHSTDSNQGIFIHPSAVLDDGATIGKGTKIWHFAHIFGGAVIGCQCSFGQNTMVANGVTIGNNVKVQNNVAIYEGTIVEDDVFLGPSCVLTNVSNPRSQVRRKAIYERTIIRRGATIGANATVVCGTELGAYCFIAAGAVVTRDVAPYALIRGVPGRHMGWMSRHGHPLEFDREGIATCPESGLVYQRSSSLSQDHNYSQSKLSAASVRCIDLQEEQPLPVEMAVGTSDYRKINGK